MDRGESAPRPPRTIPVWNRKEEIAPVPREENPLREQLDLGSKFVVMYSGNAGVVHRFQEVLEAAIVKLQESADLRDEMGSRGREAFLSRFEAEERCREWGLLLEEVVG